MAAEVCDWHRLPTAGSFGAFCGLVPITHLSVWVRVGAENPIRPA